MTTTPMSAAILRTFADELDERVSDMERNLLALERPAPDNVHAEEVRALFRAAHSMKGAARAVGVREIETVCHELESRLAPLRSGGGTPDASLIQLLLASSDALADAGVRLRAGRSLDGAPITTVLRTAQAGQRPNVPRRRLSRHRSPRSTSSSAFVPQPWTAWSPPRARCSCSALDSTRGCARSPTSRSCSVRGSSAGAPIARARPPPPTRRSTRRCMSSRHSTPTEPRTCATPRTSSSAPRWSSRTISASLGCSRSPRYATDSIALSATSRGRARKRSDS